MQNHAKTGGILSIIAGAFGVLGGLFGFILIAAVMLIMPDNFSGFYDRAAMPERFLTLLAVFYIVMGIFHALVGVLAIIGGVFALKQKHWAWALAGAIVGNLLFPLCGIPAVIFVSLGRQEFGKAVPVPPAPLQTIVG
jgi:hypothetical protein